MRIGILPGESRPAALEPVQNPSKYWKPYCHPIGLFGTRKFSEATPRRAPSRNAR